MKQKWEKVRYSPLQLALLLELMTAHYSRRYISLSELVATVYRKAGKAKPKSDPRNSMAALVRYTSAKIAFLGCEIQMVTIPGPFRPAEYWLKGNLRTLRQSVDHQIEEKW